MTARRAPGRRRGRARRVLGGLLALALLGLVAAAGAAAWAWRRLGTPYQGYAGAERRVVVAPGEDAGAILARLAAEGVLRDAALARAYLVLVRDDPPLHAGEYLFRGPLSPLEVLDKLARGDVVLHTVTVVEGLTLEETAAALAAAGLGTAADFQKAMRDPARIADLDPEARDLEGYLFPETYSFAAATPPVEIVAKLVATFRERWRAEVVPLLAGGARPRVSELVTLASIVEEEARLPEERPLVAAVYANRLRRGMGLFADPTIIFALKRRGAWTGNLRRADLELDDPYNTYRHAGLPPGPICSPGAASLRAAARPADVPHLYFVGRNDGSHVFAATLAEHNRNVERWQKEYWRARWARERAARTPAAPRRPDGAGGD